MGLDIYIGSHRTTLYLRRQGEIPSTQYPDHLWNLGYIRSSYNSGGFNSVVGKLIGKDLYWVFPEAADAYEFLPNWENAFKRANVLLAELREAGNYRTEHISLIHLESDKHPNKGKVFGEHALQHVREAFARREKDLREERRPLKDFSNIVGHFYLGEPMQLIAAIPGTNAIGSPGVHLVYQASDEDQDWYIQAAEILVEICDYHKKLNSYLAWSR